jgi:hypothetical protein
MSPSAIRSLLTSAESRRARRAALHRWWRRWGVSLLVAACAALAGAATVDLVQHAARLAALQQELGR